MVVKEGANTLARNLPKHCKSFLFKSSHGFLLEYAASIFVMSFCAVALLFINCEVCKAETTVLPGNFKNPGAVQRVLSGKETVANAAWWGFDAIDSTQAIQGAINSGARKVIIPYVGKEWVVRSIKLASNQEIVFEPGVVVTAKKGAFKGKRDCLFSADDLSNITLRGYGATLRMRKADYDSYRYTKSEFRHVIRLLGCSNINILGLRLESSGGDGIFIGTITPRPYPPCKNVLIRDCICDNNYRQGISVTSVDKLLIENCVLSNTGGTAPAAGIDLEPNHGGNMLVNVVISNCVSENNGGSGFIASISNLNVRSREVSILFVNCYARDCGEAGLRVRAVNERNRPRGLIEFRNCTSEDIHYSGALIQWEKVGSPLKLRFSDCKWRNVAMRIKEAPIYMELTRKETVSQTGGVEFSNCYIYDEKDRPFLRISDVEGRKGIYDVRGQINVFNPYGAKMDLGTTGKMSALKVKSFGIQE